MNAPQQLQDKLPELHDAILSEEQLTSLFRDYRQCATVGEIMIKSGPGYVTTDQQPTLDQAEALLRSREVRAVQIRYQFDQATWCDTLLSGAAGVRLVRIRQ